MSGLPLTFTAAGLAALVNAQATGSAGVTIASIGLASAPFTVAGTLTALPNELKQLATFGGGAVDPATMHVSVRDDSADTYDLFGFGLYLNGGVLFAVYSQPTAILGKATVSEALLSFDVRLSAAVAGDIHFGDTAFLDPPATTERAGLVELATVAEATTGTDTQRAVTPAGLKAAVQALVNGAPGALDTLAELAAAMANDANFAATVTNALALKAPLASPAFTNNPTAPTKAPGDNSTSLATTAFVEAKGGVLLSAAQGYADTKKAEAIAAAATDASGKANTAQAAAIASAQAYADTKKAEAIAAAATDASGKANAAQAAAIAAAAADATAKINALVAAAPGALDTLNELATALGNDPNFATSITNLIATRKAEAIAAAAADATTKANTAQGNAVATAAADATAKASAAQAAAIAASVFPGEIRMMGTGTVPAGWYHCDGSEKLISGDPGLFSAIGFAYGGNGSTTFRVPESRYEHPRGADGGRGLNPGHVIGSMLGDQNKSHTHGLGGGAGVRVIGNVSGFSGNQGLGGTIYATDADGGDEARGRSFAVQFIIKR